jgi:hypothetical protein
MKAVIIVSMLLLLGIVAVGGVLLFKTDMIKAPSDESAENFIKSCAKTYETKGFHIKMKFDIVMDKVKQRMEMTGKQQNPDMMYIQAKVQGQTLEGYVKGDKAVFGSSQTDTWQLQNDLTKAGKTQMLPLKQMLQASRYIKNAKFIDDAAINGIICKGVSVDLKKEGLIKLCNLEALADSYKIDFKDANYLLWYNPNDFLPYRININFGATLEGAGQMSAVSFTAECELFDYDRNIEITFPEKVKALIF